MIKNQTRKVQKLALRQETILQLAAEQLGLVVGGANEDCISVCRPCPTLRLR